MNRICIVLCTYNGERFLKPFLDSLQAQTRPADLIIAYDDGSSDSTVSILNAYQEKLPIRIFAGNVNRGHRAAFNQALTLAKEAVDAGDFIALADQDDEWIPNKLEILQKNISNSALVFGDAQVIDASGKVLCASWRKRESIPEHVSIQAQIAGNNNVTGCLAFFRASILPKILPIPEGVSVHDRWIAMVAERNGGVRAISAAVIRYRLHEANAVGGRPIPKMSETLKLQAHWVETLLQNAERIPLNDSEIKFAKELLALHQQRLTSSLLLKALPWVVKNQDDLFLPGSKQKRISQILFTCIGLPLAQKIWRKS